MRRSAPRAASVAVAAGVLAATVVAVIVAAAPADAATGTRARAAQATPHARRVLVFTVPYVSWGDVQRAHVPHLDRFVARAAIAGFSTRVDERSTPLADGYATIGAGTRTVGDPATDGDGRMVDEPFGAVTAGEAYTQRTGRAPAGAIVQPGIQRIVDANNRLHYDTEVGALAAALARAGLARAVVANGDGSEPDAARSVLDVTPPPPSQRQAVLGLMDGRGQVPAGQVDRDLLVPDPGAAFGTRLDPGVVETAFDRVWRGRAVVVVEASDLVRVARARPYATDGQRRRQLDAALRASDALFGRVLAHVDLRRDTVVVAGPAHRPGHIALTPLAIRGPDFRPGLLRSATTRRSGFVQIQDLAPTILKAVGVARPSSMEGRAAEVGATHGDAADRLHFLVRADAAARFRDARIGEYYGLMVGAVVVSAAVGFLALWGSNAARWRPIARTVALWALGLLPAAFLVRRFALDRAGAVAFYAVLLALGLLVGLLCAAVGRRNPRDGLLAGLLFIVALLTFEALRGAPLVLNSVLGYSPTVAGRFAGFGNPTYAAFSAAALLGGVLLADRVGGRRGVTLAGVLFVLAVVVDAAPMLGSDVGGILSMVPAYGVAYAVLRGGRVRVRTVVAAVAAMLAVLAVATLIDLSRPSDQRTHLGRLVEEIRDDGIGDFVSVVQRKLGANLASLGTGIAGLIVLVTVVAFVLVRWRDPGRFGTVLRAVPSWRAGCLGFAVLAVLGFAVNDSGITVPGIMLVVFVTAWVHLLVSVPATAAPPDASRPPDVGTPSSVPPEPVPA